MGAIRDWTDVPLTFNLSGFARYRIDRNGIVYWNLDLTIDGAAFYGYFTAPVEAYPVIGNQHFDFAANGLFVENVAGIFYYGLQGGLPTGSHIVENRIVYQGTELPDPFSEHTLENVMAGLGLALREIAGLRVYDFPSDRVETPAAVLSLPETPYDVTLGGREDEWSFPLWVLVAKADDKAAYKEMTAYLEADGPKSIRAMVEADRTLGGACDTAAVVRARPLFATVAGTEFLAVEFTLEVYT